MTNINELPDAVFIKVLAAKSLPTEFNPDEGNLPAADVIEAMKAALVASRRQWAALFEGVAYTDVLAIANVNVSPSGRIRLTGATGETVAVSISSRTVNVTWIEERVPAALSIVTSGAKVYLKPSQTSGSIRIKAFEQYLEDNYVSNITAQISDGQVGLGNLNNIFNAIDVLSNKDKMIALARKAIGRKASIAHEVKRHDSTETFNSFMVKKRAQMQDVALLATGKPTIDALPIPVLRTKASRTWGIEVESGGARYAETPSKWSRKRDGSLRSAWRDSGKSTYKVAVEDCVENHSDTNRDDYLEPGICPFHGTLRYSDLVQTGDDTAEFVSPILRSFHSNGLRKLTKQLSREPQNTSAGVHVHVGADGLTPKQLGGLVYAYQIIEPLITESYNREVREYCRERDTAQVLSVIRSAKNAKSVTTDLEHGGRYHSVNLQALNAHGTVEFRSMGPVYNYEHLIRWASFCREMVNLAASDVPAKVWAGVKSWSDVMNIFVKYGTETPNYLIDAMEAKLSRAEELELI
jgi:hypothetical protein